MQNIKKLESGANPGTVYLLRYKYICKNGRVQKVDHFRLISMMSKLLTVHTGPQSYDKLRTDLRSHRGCLL